MATLPPAIVDAGVTSMPSWVSAVNTYYGYCTIKDVQALFLDVANMPTSGNNKNVVALCITQAAVEMQAYLETAYQMPYAGTDLVILARLNEINAKWAGAKLYDYVFGANEPDTSTMATEWLSYAHLTVKSILEGGEQWGPPYHDAVPQGNKPAFPHSALIASLPDGTTGDPYSDQPIFTMSGLNYRKPAI